MIKTEEIVMNKEIVASENEVIKEEVLNPELVK